MANYLLTVIVLFGTILVGGYGMDEADWVDPNRLPIGWLVHPFFSALHYVYFQSENNPSKDPVVLSLGGGPGATSLRGLLYYKGPFIFMRNSTDFRHNPNNWNKKANILFIDAPAGVGLSYGDAILDDESTVKDILSGLLKFYQKWPQLKDQDLYMEGNQYAGIIIPNLAKQIIDYNNDPNNPKWKRINLKGFLIGNPCTFGDECGVSRFTKYTMNFLRSHYFITRQLYNQYERQCFFTFGQNCTQLTNKIISNFDNTGVDLFNVYQDCLHQGNIYRCIDHIGIDAFFSSHEVREDMHLDQNITWQWANFTINQKFKRNPNGSFDVYKHLLTHSNLKIWLVSGMLSAEVPAIGGKKMVDRLKLQMNLPTYRLWQSWRYNNTIHAGYVEQVRGLTYATVRSAGLYIYEDQPQIGFQLFSKFITPNATL